MADKPKKTTPPKKPVIHTLVDIVPAGKIVPSATSRPVITSTEHKHRDVTLAQPKLRSLMTHHPIKPIVPPSGHSALPSQTHQAAETVPPHDTSAPSTPPSPAGAPPLKDTATADQTVPKPAPRPLPVPEVGTPPMPVSEEASPFADSHTGGFAASSDQKDHDIEELDLSTLTGVHGITSEQSAGSTASSGTDTTHVPPPQSPAMLQTPQQAKKLAEALRELKHAAAPTPPDQPIISIHKHQYGRMFLHFIIAFVISAVVAAIAFDLLLDAQIIDLPLIPYTHFFH